jgi:hypothetical protein
MKLPRVRFTMRRMMCVVAVIAFGLAVAVIGRRQAYYFTQAERYLAYQEQDQLLLDGYKNTAWMAGYRGQSKDETVRQGKSDQYWREDVIGAELGVVYSYRRLVHHRQMVGKYLRAASRPWASVPIDPPEPNWPDRKESTTWLLTEMGKGASKQ